MKGIINENIADMLNLRPLDEVIKEKDVELDQKPEEDEDEVNQTTTLCDVSANMYEGNDHANAMDNLHNEILGHARDLMSYGFNLDHPRARGIFEIAANMYGHAITAKNSKRDAQLKAMKLAMDNKRVDLEEKRTNHMVGQVTTIGGENTILVEDRNELLRQMREKTS